MRPSSQIVNPVDIREIESKLPELPPESVEELYRFGECMISRSQQRAVRLDSKLTGILNWSSAVLAFVLIDAITTHQKGIGLALSLTVLFGASLSVLFSYLGLKAQLWPMPSEHDWFREELLHHPDMLRRYHIVSMLNLYQSQGDGSEQRALLLKRAEIALAASAVCVGCMLLYRILSA